ncbi:MAG TPA: tetratricopeptide repeat protein [Bacteroidia bacterium]|nr:tetratricopeptide repeat protein [Bacteroidia bacterium]
MQFKISFIVFLFLASLQSFGQGQTNLELANQYYSTGEYDKAAIYYEKHYQFDPFSTYDSYLKTLLLVPDYNEAEKLVKKHYKKNQKNLEIYIDLGKVYEAKGDISSAQDHYDKIIKSLTPDLQQTLNVGAKFIALQDYKRAIQVYQSGRKILNGSYPFNFELAEAFNMAGETSAMINEYLDLVLISPSYIPNVQTVLQSKIAYDLSETFADQLRVELLKRIQKNSQPHTTYNELLYWLFVQQKDFDSALIQAKALDKRLSENGNRLIALGNLCLSNYNYSTAEECFDYVLQLGKERPLYATARISLLNSMQKRITSSNIYTAQDIERLQRDYLMAIEDMGTNASTATLIADFAHFKAFYINQPDSAVYYLNKLVEMRNLRPSFIAECKLELGDIYVFTNEVWEAALLYGQVDKDFKNDALGREAKYRNARLSYYMGEFDWAKAQLDVLKAATSQLISNDAMSLSLLILDNNYDETTSDALIMFSRADLLAYRNQFDIALSTLDSLIEEFPGHALSDEAWYKKSQILKKQQQYTKAADLLKKIVDEYPKDILADDALFELADLSETKLNNKDEAQRLFEKLLTDYPGSLYVIEARKRFRILRGDKI